MANTVIPVNNRSSDSSRSQQFFEAIGRSQSNLNEAQSRVSTGKNALSYRDKSFADTTRAALNLEENKYLATEARNKFITLGGRLNSSLIVIRRLEEIATEGRQRVASAKDSTVQDMTFAEFCVGKLAEVETLMNKTDSEGRYLFGGQKTLGTIVDLSLAAVPAAGTLPTPAYAQAYFTGESTPQQTTFRDGVTLDYMISADDPAFRDLVFWFKMGTSVVPDGIPGSPASLKLDGMLDGLGNAVNEIAKARQKLGPELEQVENIEETTEDDKIYFSQSLAALNDARLFEEFIRSSTEFLRMNLNQILLSKEVTALQSLLSQI